MLDQLNAELSDDDLVQTGDKKPQQYINSITIVNTMRAPPETFHNVSETKSPKLVENGSETKSPIATTHVENVTTSATSDIGNLTQSPYIWPRDLNDRGARLLNQMEYGNAHIEIPSIPLSKGEHSVELKMIYKDRLNRLNYNGRSVFLNEECPINSCYIVNQENKEDNSSNYYDAYVISGVYLLDTKIKLKPNAIRIWYQLESPLNAVCPTRGINWTATYRSSSTLPTPYEFFRLNKKAQFNRTTNVKNYASGKSKMAAIFMSNCKAKNNRSAMVVALQQYISVDVYGKCGTLYCGKHPTISKQCFKNMSRDYKFYLSFENCNCREYITEKFFVNGLG